MLTIYFLYGLAFIMLGVVIFATSKKSRLIKFFDDNLWLLGLFGFIHGVCEWIDLFILWGRPFNPEILMVLGAILFPISFLALVMFAAQLIVRVNPKLSWLKFFGPVVFLGWGIGYFLNGDLVLSNIAVRYSLCLPGTLLSATGFFLVFKKIDSTRLPRLISVSMLMTIIVFILYGFFSGLIVPEKNFLLASSLNYSGFKNLIGIPIQFFRMVCAMLLSVSLFGIIGVFKLDEKGKIILKGGIRQQVTMLICSATLILISIGIFLLYLFGLSTMRNSIGKDYAHVSSLLSKYLVQSYNGEIEDVRTYATRPLWIDSVKEKNLVYQGFSEDDKQRFFKEMDQKWMAAGFDSSLVKTYTDNRVAESMKEILSVRGNISELFITDKFGGLVAASDKTSDYYQADEAWWQKAYDEGRGKIFVGQIEFDESSGSWIIPMAVPIRDKNKNVIGVCKEGVAIKRFLEPLMDFSIGKTGHAVLVDQNNRILFHEGFVSTKMNFCSEKDFQDMVKTESGYRIINEPGNAKRKVIAAYAKIFPPVLAEKGIYWMVFIVQDADEAFEPLNIFVSDIALVIFILFFIMLPVGYVFGNLLARPIHALHLATEKVMAGDWDYKIEVKTGDEIEQFADTFREMIEDIKKKQMGLLAAKLKSEELALNLEKRVLERTKELSEVNEATLNILEDLTLAKESLAEHAKKLEKALTARSDFISTVSHELRTPLTAMKEGIAIVLDGSAGPVNHDQKEFLDLAKRNVDRLARLINQVLDFQKLESGLMVFDIKEEDINTAIKDVCQTMSVSAKQKGLELVCQLQEGLVLIYFDRDKIIQVISNLVNNAIKFTDKGTITLNTAKGNNFVQVSVKDTGVGVKEEDLPKLFQKFSQLGNVNERKTGGSGLGLAISKEIIEKHHGKIWAESRPGEGTVFHFLLPIKERRV